MPQIGLLDILDQQTNRKNS